MSIVPIIVPVTFTGTQTTIPVNVGSSSANINIRFDYVINVVGADNFEGDYEYTPTAETQVIPIAEKRATQDIIINPIPSNYGLITWNGSVLTVS